jgi:glycosidase
MESQRAGDKKTLTRRARSFLGAIACASAAALSMGCMEFDDGMAGEIELGTHVVDWRQEIIYQLLVDRFADGDAGNNFRVDLSAQGKYHGGDWRGLWEKLDYLEELGVTTLWISPVVKNVDTDAGFDGYHGYWAQDIYQTNPHYGDLASLRRLVAGAHERNMKVILDIVTNHMGQIFYYDINRNGEPDDRVSGNGSTSPVGHINEYDPDFDLRGVQSFTSLGEAGPAPVIFVYDAASNHVPPTGIFGYADVYNRRGRTYNFGNGDQLLLGDFPGGLKDVDTTRCDVKEAMVDAYARWVELTDLDGFRIDTVKHVERGFWRYFTQRIRQRLAAKGKKNFFMFGEAFDGDDALVGSFTKNDLPSPADLKREKECVADDDVPLTGDQLDSVFYFPQHFQAIRDVFQDAQGTQRIQDLWNNRPVNYGTEPMKDAIGLPPTKALVNFIDNHDVPRFLYSGKGVPALHNALTFLFTEDGLPCIYYGTEQEFAGGNDPANREDLWTSEYKTDKSTFQWIRKLSRIRRTYPALTVGDLFVTWSSNRTEDEPDAGIFAFERRGGDAGDSYALVVFNTNKNHPSSPQFEGTPMLVDAAAGTVLVDVLSAESKTYTVDGNKRLSITLPPESGAILIPQAQVVQL